MTTTPNGLFALFGIPGLLAVCCSLLFAGQSLIRRLQK